MEIRNCYFNNLSQLSLQILMGVKSQYMLQIMQKITTLIIGLILITCIKSGVVPTSQIKLYPNTQNSPSLYLISFKTSQDLQINEYILISMDWLSSPINPFSCLLVNTTIDIACTNIGTPSFALGFSITTLQAINPQISSTRTLVIQLLDPLPANVQYFLSIGLTNVVENLKKISPSMQIYCIDNSGLIHQVNLNFGPVAYKPPITNILSVSVYTDINNLAIGIPGTLVTSKTQIQIGIPVTTSLSSLFFVLKQPFQFSQSSYIIVDESEDYGINPIALNRKPLLAFYEVVTPHLFYVAFNQTFPANRKFIVQITQIKNPFFIATSNVSIYSANFNSLTPLEAYQSILSIKTVTQTLSLTLGLPYDMPMREPCVFYRNKDNLYQVKFNMPIDVPAGYAIKVLASQNTIYDGSGYVNFQSLNYTTVYQYYGSNYFIMSKMGPILQGSLISIIFKGVKDSITNFYVSVYIDTQAIIFAGTATNYMFYGRADAQSVDANDFFYYMYSSPQYQVNRLDSAMTGSEHIRMSFYPYVTTSSGSYIQMYFTPDTNFQPNFDPNSDCRFNDVAGSAVCAVTKTANYVYIQFNSSVTYAATNPNAFVQNQWVWLYIYKIRFPRTTTNQYPFFTYFRLFNSSAVNPTTYIQASQGHVMPRSNTLSGISLIQGGNVNTSSTKNYPGFVRFESNTPSQMAYTLQQNEVRVISIYSNYGFRGLSTYSNQASYPCASNTYVSCIYNKGVIPYGQYWRTQIFSTLQRIDIFFQQGSNQTTNNFHIIVPDGINTNSGGNYYYFYMMGIYNLLTKDYKYLYRNSGFYRNPGWVTAGANNQASMLVDFQGKAGSYRNNVTVTTSTSGVSTNYMSYIVITSAWSLFQNSLTSYSTATLASVDPKFYTNQLCPLSVSLGSGMYMAVFPFKIFSSPSTFKFYLNNLHMPYNFDLPNYYIYVISNGNNNMVASNQFQMTNQGVFYETYLKSLTISCLQNHLGVQNTICTVNFGTQNPLKANGQIIMCFSGMQVSTNVCSVFLPNGTSLTTTCTSTTDNKNVTISMVDVYNSYQYPAHNFSATVNGISITADQISQSVTLYLTDSTGRYIIEKGTRILTTTVAQPQSIIVDQIVYKYLSPLSANKMSIRFSLPRTIYSDQRLGFIMGQDLSNVNLQLQRLKIVLTRSDGLEIPCTNQLISSEYKVLFTFSNTSQITATSYTLEIYGIMTPVSHQNGAFQMIYQRSFDKAYTLINNILTVFPTFYPRISSGISMQAFYNTQGYEQKLVFTLVNTNKVVNSNMIWIVNFPSYYNQQLFNFNAYCLIDTAPIQCLPDPTTKYQLIIRNSPKIIMNGTQYTISIFRLACPRAKYTNNYYRSYYLFIGVLENSNSDSYSQSALLYPQQSIQSAINGILTVSDVIVNTLTRPTFSSIYAIMLFTCNVNIPAGSYLFLVFPFQFDNFNNNPISIIFKIGNSIAFSLSAPVVDRTLQILISTSSPLTLNTVFSIEFPSLPTPKLPSNAAMSDTIGYITASDKKSILAASSTASNSAPILSFTPDVRYISFNHDNTVSITAGTYSQAIDITSSDSQPFLTNVVVNLTSAGFTFDPSSVFLQQGNTKGQFRIGADTSLFPISYFYDTIKSQEVFTYYTITKNNNIRVTNTPVQVSLPSTISIPLGGCSTPFIIDIINPPLNDVTISFSYNNQMYNQSIIYPNSHISKSQLSYSPIITQRSFSFCVASSFVSLGLSSTFTMRFLFSGTNYKSYAFTPSQNVTVTIGPAVTLASSPAVTLQLVNRQKTFLDFNIIPTVPGNLFYELRLGQNVSPMDIADLQLYLKNNQTILQSNNDFFNYLYTTDRDQRVGVSTRQASGVFTLRFNNLLPERFYTFCVYLQTFSNVLISPTCLSVQTQIWGVILTAKVAFTRSLDAFSLNKVLCFFAKNSATQVGYVVDLQGNSCNNRAVKNNYFLYSGTTFSSQNLATNLYLITNPTITSDPSPTAFANMFDSNSQLSASSISSALSGFAINYISSSSYLGSSDAFSMTSVTNPDSISISFDQSLYDTNLGTISIPNVALSTYGTAYFVLVLYKQVNINGNNSFVKIRLNDQPTQQQILNCNNYQNLPAQGCARAVYSYYPQTVTFNNILPNCMYMLYYMAASQYPLRPIVSSNILSNSIVTFVFETRLHILVMLLFVIGLALL